MSSAMIAWERQREVDKKSNDLIKLQKGKPPSSKYDEVKKKCMVHLGESELALKEILLLTENENVYKLIGPVLVKQDHAEAIANIRKRIDYLSAELKRVDANLEDLEERQNSKKAGIFKLQQRIQSLMVGKGKEKV